MKKRGRWLRVGFAVVGFLALGFALNTQAGLFDRTKQWKEEVVLHDGRIVVVERRFKLGGFPSPDAHERAVLDETISFVLPDSDKQISWYTEFKNDVPEPNGLGPLLVDVVGGVPYLATSPAGCIAYNKWGRPNPPYTCSSTSTMRGNASPWKSFRLNLFTPI